MKMQRELLSRRDAVKRSALSVAGVSLGATAMRREAVASEAATMQFEHKGMFIRECSLPGEMRKDDVFPAHPGGIQVGRDRWLILYATRGFRGGDDDRSVVYQLRRGGPDGDVIKEGMLARSINDWDPLNDGTACVRQHGHPVAFGVPSGALVNRKPVAHGNLFAVKWRVMGLKLDQASGRVSFDRDLWRKTQAVEWVQLRLTPDQNDIEIVQPVQRMRQIGFEDGEQFCSVDVSWMNQTFVQAVPFNSTASEWIDCNHCEGGKVLPLKYRFNADRGLYEWVETGNRLYDRPVSEASIVKWGDDWIVSARYGKGAGGIPWVRTSDPFSNDIKPVYGVQPKTGVPRMLYLCADGVLRVFSGEGHSSPYKDYRNPLYCWDVDPDNNFQVSNRQVIFDSVKAGFNPSSRLMVGMCKLMPPVGNKQMLVHRVAPRVYRPILTNKGMADCGIYHGWLTFNHVDPTVAKAQTPWLFADDA